jgi:hypothetical protein
MMGGSLLGSSNTLDGIRSVIARFYAGESKELAPIDADSWSVLRTNGEALPGVIVRLKRGRYRFEST